MVELDAQKLSSTAKTLERQIKTYNICDDCTRSQPNLELNFGISAVKVQQMIVF